MQRASQFGGFRRALEQGAVNQALSAMQDLWESDLHMTVTWADYPYSSPACNGSSDRYQTLKWLPMGNSLQWK
jgi:hypothetical protein